MLLQRYKKFIKYASFWARKFGKNAKKWPTATQGTMSRANIYNSKLR